MMIKIFKNYGCRTAEKRVVYTYGFEQPTAVSSDVLTVEIPGDWKSDKNELGEIILVSPWGWNYSVNEVLAGNEHPIINCIDKDGRRYSKRLVVCND